MDSRLKVASIFKAKYHINLCLKKIMRTYHFLTYRTGMYRSKFSPTGNLSETDFVQIDLDSEYRCRIVPNRPFTFIEITMYENDMYGLHASYHVKKCLKKFKERLKTKTTSVKIKNIIYIKLCKNQGGGVCENCCGLRFEPGQW